MNQGITLAGAGAVDITPRTPEFLYGYPHVPRISTGTFDPRVPVLFARDTMGKPIGIMVAANMHPTVLHEDSVLPSEIHVVAVGGYTFACWPGEVFVEFGLGVAAHRPHTHVLTLCNGDYQGYLVSAQAVEQSFYEAGTAILKSPESGERLVQTTIRLLDQLSVNAAE